jgi:signal transduction histidine kinase
MALYCSLQLSRSRGGATVREPVGVRTEYLLDAGRSHGISDALQPVLAEIRALLGASIGLVTYRPKITDAHLLVLAADAPGLPEPPLPNETFQADRLPVRRASALADVELTSTLRPYRILLRSAVLVPWSDPYGDGMVVVGRTGVRPGLPEPASDLVRRLRSDLRRSMSSGRRHGAMEINRDLHRAMKDVAAATVECADVSEALTTLLVSAKWLFDSEVAYLSLPEDDVETFTFDQVLGIRTPDFRHLRIRGGQGLGGLARSLRRPVRSLNYARDSRLFAAPVAETVREGIVSAMAAPIMVDDQIQAVLYVGDRALRPFSATDEEVLGEFAEYATLGLKRQATEDYRHDVLRRQEQERLAYDLHDTAVRGLLEIGFAAERARAAAHGGPEVAAGLESIAAAAERCMEALRGQLDLLIQGTSGRTAGAVLEEIAEASLRPETRHRFVVHGPEAVLPNAVADALVRIGQEALVNVDLHAGGSPADVSLQVTADEWILSVANDGSGNPPEPAPEDHTRAHLGLAAMQKAAGKVLGRVERFSSSEGGYVVRAIVPTMGG